MNRRATQSIVANPVLVGAVTTLIVIVAVFLAYNANNGLPFVPTTELNVQVESASNLVAGNEVREGGFRIGVIEEITPISRDDGTAAAELKLKLDKSAGTIPEDTRVKIRPRSALGLKYVELSRGKSGTDLPNGATLPLGQSSVPVQFDDIFKIFDEDTRKSSQVNLDGFGNAFAGRGGDLNVAISELPEFVRSLEPVMRLLADDRTQLRRFFAELGDAARVVAPLADVQARLFTHMATTFEAFSRDPEALKATIEKSPPTLATGTASFRAQRPFLRNLAAFSADLRGATRELRAALPIVNPALERGTPVLRRSVELNEQLGETLGALYDLSRAPTTNAGLRALTDTVKTLNPMLRYLGPYVTVCNYWNYWWTYVAEHFAESTTEGNSQRALLNAAPTQTNSVGSAGAFRPANAEGYAPGQEENRGDKHALHGQPYGAAINTDGTADCESGQRGYLEGPLHVFGDQSVKAVLDPHTPGSQGTTFTGRQRVPRGQTFTREPQTGAQLAPELTTGVYAAK